MIVVGKKRPGCGCVKLGGCRSSAGMAGMGEMTPDRLRAEWERVSREASAKFARPMTYAQLYKGIAPHLERATKFVATAKTMRGLRPGQLAEIVAAAARLQRVRNAAKVGYANTPNKLAGDLQAEAREAALAPIRWLAGLTGQLLKDSTARAAFVKTAAKKLVNAPGSIIAWAGEQATQGLKGFGLPGWLLPVGLVVAGLVVAGPYVMPLVVAARKGAT